MRIEAHMVLPAPTPQVEIVLTLSAEEAQTLYDCLNLPQSHFDNSTLPQRLRGLLARTEYVTRNSWFRTPK